MREWEIGAVENIHGALPYIRFAPILALVGVGVNRIGKARSKAMHRAIADLMVGPVKRYEAQVRAGENPWNTIDRTAVDAAAIARTAPPGPLLNALLEAPLALVVCVDLAVVASTDQYLDRVGVASGASIYPFVWNILLAARNEGFGGVPTTFAVAEEDRVQALLGLPRQFAVAAIIPLGKPVRQLTKLRRNSVESFTRLERWDGAPSGQAGRGAVPRVGFDDPGAGEHGHVSRGSGVRDRQENVGFQIGSG